MRSSKLGVVASGITHEKSTRRLLAQIVKRIKGYEGFGARERHAR